MKLALVAPTYLPARRANTIQVMKMAQALVRQGHTVRLAVPGPHPPGLSRGDLSHQYGLEQEFPIEWLPAHPAFRSYDFGLRAVLWARRWGADMLYTRHPQAAALASLVNLPTILEIHDLSAGRFGGLLFRVFLHGQGALRIVSITLALATDLGKRFNVPLGLPFCLIAPDGVDLDRFIDLPKPLAARRALAESGVFPQLALERFTAGYTGHLYAGRGVELLLELASLLPTINVLVVGGEPGDLQRLEEVVAQKGLTNFFLAGFVPNAELPRYQAACDVLLMPYQARVAASSGGDIARYLSPMKLFEYMACQRPILCSDLPVLREVLNEANALLLPPQEIAAWAEALMRLANDASLGNTLAERAYQDVQQYTWERRAALILSDLPGRNL
jgi:glycosyltransferase involved in cell wall biosynthesis